MKPRLPIKDYLDSIMNDDYKKYIVKKFLESIKHKYLNVDVRKEGMSGFELINLIIHDELTVKEYR